MGLFGKAGSRLFGALLAAKTAAEASKARSKASIAEARKMLFTPGKRFRGMVQLGDAAWQLGVAVILIVVILSILTTLQGTQSSGSEAYNTTRDSITAIGQFADWFPILVVIVVAAVVLGYLYVFRGGPGKKA